MGVNDIFAVLFEYGPESVGRRLFARQGMPRSLTTADFRPYLLRRGLGGQSGTQWFFTEAGRPFTFYAVLGSHARRTALVPRVNALIGDLVDQPRPVRRQRRFRSPLRRVPDGTDRPLPGRLRPAGRGRGGQGRAPDRHRPRPRRAGAPAPGRDPPGRSGSGRWPRRRSACVAILVPRAGSAWLVALSYRRLRRLRRLRPARGAVPSPVAAASGPRTPRPPCSMSSSTWAWPWPPPSVAVAGADRHHRLGPRPPARPRTAVGGGQRALRLAHLSGHLGAGRAPGGPPADRGRFPVRAVSPRSPMTVTTLVERASSFLESRLSRRSFINRSAYAGSAVAIGAGLDLVLKPGTAYGLVCTCGNGNCGCGSTCCAGFSEFCCSVNGGLQLLPDRHGDGRLVEGGQLVVLRRPPLLHGLQRDLPVRHRLRRRVGLLRAGMRRDQLRLRPGRVRLVPHRLLPVPLRPVQPGCRLHRPHRLPGGGLRPSLGGRSHLHHRHRRGRRHRRAECARAGQRPHRRRPHLLVPPR